MKILGLEFKIAKRYLRSKKKNRFISFISGLSTLGLTLAIVSLITILSVMNGFHKEIRGRILSAIAHANINHISGNVENWQEVIKNIKHKDLVATAPYITKYGMLVANNQASGVFIRGINPEYEKNVSILVNKIKYGTANIKKYEILLGQGLANKLGVTLNGYVILLTPNISNSIIGLTTKFKKFKVVGIFNAGLADYDNSLAFISLYAANKLYKMNGKVSGIRLQVNDIFKAKAIGNDIARDLGDKYYAIDWGVQKRNIFQALQLEKQMIAIILVLIITIAMFNVVSMMVMVVTEKKSDIAILRTIGMTPKNIIKIFFLQSLIIGLIGIVVGTILGLLLSYNIEAVISSIESLLGFQFFPEQIFYINKFPSDIQITDVIYVTTFSFILVILSAIYPAYRAGKTNIIETLKYG